MQARACSTNGGDDAFEEPHARREAFAAIAAAARLARQDFVQQVAVAALDVDEVEACAMRDDGGADVVLADRFEFRVGNRFRAIWQRIPTLEQRMALRNARQEWAMRPREATGVRELESDQRAFRQCADFAAARAQFVQQALQIALAVVVQAQLARVGLAVFAHRKGLAAPDQRSAAAAEVPPSPQRVCARAAVRRAVPAFHRVRAEPVVEALAAQLDRLRQRTVCAHRIVTSEVDAEFCEVRAECGGGAIVAGWEESHGLRIMQWRTRARNRLAFALQLASTGVHDRPSRNAAKASGSQP